MMKRIDRRAVLGGGIAGAASLLAPPVFAAPPVDLRKRLTSLEGTIGGRLGVAILDTGPGGRIVGQRMDERFALLSSFKFLAAALVLARVDSGDERLDRRIVFTRDDLVEYSPATETRVGEPGMTMAELCEAAITLSDNTAGNMLLRSFGGPSGLTRFVRGKGDAITRLDRWETELNESKPGDPGDTTSPLAMIGHLQRFVLGDALSPSSRTQLDTWLLANTTGAKRLKAGLPEDWKIGDKTGTSSAGTSCDVGVIYPPGRAPILVAAYLAETEKPVADQNAVFAEIGRLAAGMVA